MGRRQALVAIGAYGIPGAQVSFPTCPFSDEDWLQVRLDIRHQRLTGLALAAAEAGRLPTTEKQRQELAGEHDQALAHVLRLEAHLVRIADLLGGLGLRFLVLKGSAVAHLDYPDPALRTFGDSDVLVPADQIDDVLAVLARSGYRRPAPEAAEGFDRRFGKGASLIGRDAYELDVHRTFAMGPFGYTVDLAELWQQPQSFRLGGRQMWALNTEQRMLHACYHAVIGNPAQRLQPHRDVAEMFLFGDYDPERVVALAEHWQAGAVVARAVTTTWQLFAMDTPMPLLSWASLRVASPREERLMAVYRAGTSYAAKCLACLSVMPRWRDRAAFVRYLAMPDDEFVKSRARSRLGWLSRGVVHAIRGR